MTICGGSTGSSVSISNGHFKNCVATAIHDDVGGGGGIFISPSGPGHVGFSLILTDVSFNACISGDGSNEGDFVNSMVSTTPPRYTPPPMPSLRATSAAPP